MNLKIFLTKIEETRRFCLNCKMTEKGTVHYILCGVNCRCLVENKGQVAFIKHTTVQDVVDTAPSWASGVTKSNYRLLCKDGTSKPMDQFEQCNLAKVYVCHCTKVENDSQKY